MKWIKERERGERKRRKERKGREERKKKKKNVFNNAVSGARRPRYEGGERRRVRAGGYDNRPTRHSRLGGLSRRHLLGSRG